MATVGSLLATTAFPMATPAYTYTAEVFPTTARGTAASVCDGLATWAEPSRPSSSCRS